MASNARIFFAGIGTTFLIIGAGFGGGLMFAKSALHDQMPVQTRASSQLNPVRVILPTTAEAAEAPQAPQQTATVPVQPAPPEVKVPEKQVEKVDTRKAEAEERARKKRYAERKARKIAKQMEAKQQVEQRPGIMAFDGDQPRTVGFFGN